MRSWRNYKTESRPSPSSYNSLYLAEYLRCYELGTGLSSKRHAPRDGYSRIAASVSIFKRQSESGWPRHLLPTVCVRIDPLHNQNRHTGQAGVQAAACGLCDIGGSGETLSDLPLRMNQIVLILFCSYLKSLLSRSLSAQSPTGSDVTAISCHPKTQRKSSDGSSGFRPQACWPPPSPGYPSRCCSSTSCPIQRRGSQRCGLQSPLKP